VQRVTRAEVRVEGAVTGAVGTGLLVLLGVGPGDTPDTARALATKVARLRIFSDDAGKMNRAVTDVGGGVLSVSQFTLYGDTTRGNRPSFTGAAPPDEARALWLAFNEALRGHGLSVQEGVFGADMKVDLVNDGPVTLMLEL
jgi:D-tyrosyl-tRNA(Tyr) deacylase